jgi:hypothetical protein
MFRITSVGVDTLERKGRPHGEFQNFLDRRGHKGVREWNINAE